MQVTPSEIALLLAMSLFFGLAFEEFYAQDIPNRPGGVRTFPLLALAGAALYAVEPTYSLAFIAGLGVLGTWIYAYYRRLARPHSNGAASEGEFVVPVCNILAYTLGALALSQPAWALVAVTVVATLLLAGRRELHRIAARVPIDEVFTAGKFLLLVGVVLPLLPDTPIPHLSGITAHKILLAVVAVSSLSYGSYLLQRYVRPKDATLLAAALGGLYSSTATTVVLARQSRDGGSTRDLSTGIVLATGLMYVRVLAVVLVFNWRLGTALALPMLALCGFSAVLAAALYLAAGPRGQTPASRATGFAAPSNPLQIGAALTFAALFVIVTLASNWVQGSFGTWGIYALAAVVGVTDIDPFVLSIAQGGVAAIGVAGLVAAVLIAASSNNLLKAAYALAFGDARRMMLPAISLFTLAAAGCAAAYIVR